MGWLQAVDGSAGSQADRQHREHPLVSCPYHDSEENFMCSQILVIGESLIDIVHRPGEPARYLPGGSPLNVAVGLGRLGESPLLATWYGGDELGQLIANHCAESGVILLPGSDQSPRTSTADATISPDGQATYRFDIEWQMPPVSPELKADQIHAGSIGALVTPGRENVLKLIESRRHGFVSFDPNCRPSIMGDRAEVVRWVERYVAASDLVKVSDADLGWLYDTDGETAALIRARSWTKTGPAVVVVTFGGQGAVAVTTEGLTVRVPADTSHGLVDTVGAGDAFMAGLIYGVRRHGYADADTPRLGSDRAALETILRQAAHIAGITVSRAGANPPWLAELQSQASER